MPPSPVKYLPLSDNEFARVAQWHVQDNPVRALTDLKAAATHSAQAIDGENANGAERVMRLLNRMAGPLQETVYLLFAEDPEVDLAMGRYLHRADKALDSIWFLEQAHQAWPDDTHVMARYADALMDAHPDAPSAGYMKKALELAQRAHLFEHSEYTADLLHRVRSNTGNGGQRASIAPTSNQAPDFPEATLAH